MFEKPQYFLLFFAVPFLMLLLILDIILTKKRAKKIAGDNIKLIIPYYTEGQKWIKFVFFTIAFCLTILALARPKWGITTIDSKIKGRDILILLDVSYSMSTNDVIPSRYEMAKNNIIELLKTKNSDRIGLMVFSGESELISPITYDYAAINFFLDSLYPGMLGKGGTNIAKAISDGIKSFEDEGLSNNMILLISDGENLQGDIKGILKKVKESKIKLFTIGVGTKDGKPIPIRNSDGNIITYVKDNKGKHVISKLNETILISIANETDGLFLGNINKKTSITSGINKINNVEKKEQNTINFNQKKDRYNIFLIPALILFSLGFILDQGKLIKLKYNKFEWLFNKKIILFLLLSSILILPINFYAKNDRHSNNKSSEQKEPEKNKFNWIGRPNGGFWGNISFKKKNYKHALENYFSAINFLKDEKLANLYYNIANAFYKIDDQKNATAYYENALDLTKDKKLKSNIFYNQGLVEFKNQNYSAASELFKKVVKIDELDDNARYNYIICNELKKEAENYYNRYIKEKQEDKSNEEKQNKQNQTNKNKQLSQLLSDKYIENLLKTLDEKEKKEIRERSKNRESQDLEKIKYW